MKPILPADLERKRNNQRILAEAQRWPEGVLQACADLEDRHPGWHVSWMNANTTPGWERPAGFYASYNDHAGHHEKAYAPDAEGMEPLLVEVPPHDSSVHGCDWCWSRIGR